MDISTLHSLVEKAQKEKKEWMVYDVVTGRYTQMSTRKKDRIEKEFGTSTTLGKVYRIRTKH